MRTHMDCLILINHLKDVSLNIWDRPCIALTWKLLLVAEALVSNSSSHTTHPASLENKKPGGNGKVDADAFVASPSAACRCLIQTHEHTHTLHCTTHPMRAATTLVACLLQPPG